MLEQELREYGSAAADFRKARKKANMQEILSRIKGESTQLLSFDEVRQMLRLQGGTERGIRDIPIDAIVGSVGRYTDFNKDFLPLRDSDLERWARVKVANNQLVGLPPIEVYQIGEVYFVKDGNHRVSVARQLGATHIQAYVHEVRSRVPIAPDDNLDDLILKAEYVRFLDETRLDELRPGANLITSIPGQFELLVEHIEVHRYYMGIEYRRDISKEEAVTHWYDEIYLPIVKIVREAGILRDYPGRTEADLYIWISQHRAQLQEQLGVEIDIEQAAYSMGSSQTERDGQTDYHPEGERLFNEILVPVDGKEGGWFAFGQAVMLAQRERSKLYGLYVCTSAEQVASPSTSSLRELFEARLKESQVDGKLIVTSGDTIKEICLRAAWTDLVVINMSYPPRAGPRALLTSRFRDLVRRCSSPILVTPRATTPLHRAILAYNGSPKADEALSIAAYFAKKMDVSISVVFVAEGTSEIIDPLSIARSYLEKYGIQADFVERKGDFVPTLTSLAKEWHIDLIIMGGYRISPWLEVLSDSAVNKMLRTTNVPMLICQ